MKGLYSGRQILALKTQGKNITRSQTAAQAEKAIIRKYGSISPGGKYFHLGKGNWKKYSLESDRTRTGRLAPDLKTWREAPHKWDREGVDTKKEGSGKKKARVFSMTALKGVSKPITRKSIDIGSLQRARIAVKQGYNFKVGFEWTNNSKDRYRITGISGTGNNKNIKYINVAIPSKTYVTTENDLTFDLRMQKRSRKIKIEMKEREEKSRKAELEQKKKEEAEYQKKLEGLEGFETTLSKMNKPRAIELFNGFIRTNGKIKTRKDMIRDLIKAGYIVGKDKKGKTQLVKDSSVYDNLTKTEYNFAEYLIKKWKIKPKLSLSTLKGPAKLAGRKNKAQPKLARYTEITPKGKVVIEQKKGRAKALKYRIEILRNQGKDWENSGMIVDSKEKADAIIASTNSDGFGRKLRAIPVYHITGAGVPYHTYEPAETKITKKSTKPKSEIKANHVYGSFMRPLWIGFNPGVQYREIKVTDSHKDFRFNRKPHAVVVTAQPIAEEKIKALELTDLIKGKKLAREVKRIKGLNFLDDNMKESLISQVLAGKDKAVIDKYIEKGKQMAEKKQKKQKFSVSKLSQSGKLASRKSKTQLKNFHDPITKEIKKPIQKWNFVDQTHPNAMYLRHGNIIHNADKYTKDERIKWLNMELARIKSNLKGERAVKVNGLYNVRWANKNAQAMKANRIKPLMDQKNRFEEMLRLEKGLPLKPVKTDKPHVQYFDFRNGESSNHKKNSNYWKLTDKLYPKYYTAQNGNKFYEGWINEGEIHYSNNKTPAPVKNPAVL